MKFTQYWYRSIYLQSDHWRDLRIRKLELNPSCEQCGSRDNLDCHHLRYRDIYNCTSFDLETLCRKCHETEHAKKNAPLSKGGGMKDFDRERREKWIAARAKVSKLGRNFKGFNIAKSNSKPQIHY